MKNRNHRGLPLSCALSLALTAGLAHAQTPAAPRFDAGTVSGLGARNIGSAAMSGRISALAAHVEDGKTTIYVGAASGGVWKSIDSGTSFKPLFDKQPVQSIGAIALDPQNPKTVWVGTGESWTRNSVSVGNGVYRSTDGGESWTFSAPVPEGDVHARHLYSVLVTPETGWTRDALIAHLAKAGIATSVHFRALHLHPYYQERYRLQRGMFPEAERVSDQVVSLPLGGGMSDDEAWIVVEALRRAISVRTR